MIQTRPLRVVHIPTAVGGNPEGLSSHLNELGVHSEVWEVSASPFGYKADRTLWHSDDGLIRREWKRWKAIWRVARDFDVIHFNFGTTLSLPFPFSRSQDKGWKKKAIVFVYALYSRVLLFLELTLYRMHRRPMFVHYQGDDARQGDYCLANFEHSIAKYADKGYYCRYTDRFKRHMISVMDRNCEQIYAVNPDLLHVLPSRARFIPYCHISLDEWVPGRSDAPDADMRPLRIGHAPSHRGAKGTALILDALNQLRAEGYQFELDLIEGLSRRNAMRRYQEVDILIDQLYAGWYGGVAVEAMALGKPVMVYVRKEDLAFLPEQMRDKLPLLEVSPESVLESIRAVLQKPRSELREIGKASRAFVEHWHDPLRIAAEIKNDYEQAIEKRW